MLLNSLTVLTLFASVAAAQTPLHDLHGSAPGDRFGATVAGCGDVNADGVPDLAVGAPSADPTGANSGAVRVLSGSDGAMIFELTGSAAGDRYGFSVAGAGDVDGDGYADVIVGAPYSDAGASNGGSVQVVSGRDQSVLLTRDGGTPFGFFGFSVGRAGDHNGDGRDEVLIGAPQEDGNGPDSGVVYVYSLAQHTPLFTVAGDAAGDQLGRAVAGVGDVDGDGIEDWMAGANLNDAAGQDAGQVRVWSGANQVVLHTFLGQAAGDELGLALSGAGDVDMDGYPDLVVGAWAADAGGVDHGTALVFSGLTGAGLHTFGGDAPGDRFGWAVSSAGDLDGDGHADVLVGAPYADSLGLGARTGLVRAFSGRTGLEQFTFPGSAGGSELGAAVHSVGDVNADGHGEVLVGAPLADPADASHGRAWVLTSAGHPPRTYCTASPNSTGQAATIGWSGTLRASLDAIALHAHGLPRSVNTVFAYGPQSVQQPIGDGTLCIGPHAGAIWRLPPGRSDHHGSVTHELDLGAPPAPGGMILPGSTWYFQCWYRDPAAGGTGLNLSDGLELTFVP